MHSWLRRAREDAGLLLIMASTLAAAAPAFDPIALDPSGKTSVGAFVLNRDASRAAVATYSRGSEITDYRVIDTRTGAQIGPLLPGIEGFHWARDERYAFV